MPVDADIAREDEVPYRSLDVNEVLDKMDLARTAINLVVLDACRNNPFARSFRLSQVGLAQMDAPQGTLISFATAPGSVAQDGDGANGLFTGALLKHIRERGLAVEQMFKRVRVDVARGSNNQQVPWESSSLNRDFPLLQNRPGPLLRSPRWLHLLQRARPNWHLSWRFGSPSGAAATLQTIRPTLNNIRKGDSLLWRACVRRHPRSQ